MIDVWSDEGLEGVFEVREHAEGYARELREKLGARAWLVDALRTFEVPQRSPENAS